MYVNPPQQHLKLGRAGRKYSSGTQITEDAPRGEKEELRNEELIIANEEAENQKKALELRDLQVGINCSPIHQSLPSLLYLHWGFF